ncbi:MAG: hypothetical protein WA876_15535 [Candidatus Acidiferrales bacterium]
MLEAPRGMEGLLDFCKSEGINEVYVSVSERSEVSEERRAARLIGLLHRSNIRVEALISSIDADEPGEHRETLLEHAREIVRFNESHPAERFDGIHLDVEPQQRPENKGAGDLRFLPGLVDAFRAVRGIAEPGGMTVNADIPNKLLRGDLEERKMLLSAVPRVTLMMYELSSPEDGESAEQMEDKAQRASENYLAMAYDGLSGKNLAKMVIALRTPDYGELIGQMLKRLDDANSANPHYLGWARHSYNDYLKARTSPQRNPTSARQRRAMTATLPQRAGLCCASAVGGEAGIAYHRGLRRDLATRLCAQSAWLCRPVPAREPTK